MSEGSLPDAPAESPLPPIFNLSHMTAGASSGASKFPAPAKFSFGTWKATSFTTPPPPLPLIKNARPASGDEEPRSAGAPASAEQIAIEQYQAEVDALKANLEDVTNELERANVLYKDHLAELVAELESAEAELEKEQKARAAEAARRPDTQALRSPDIQALNEKLRASADEILRERKLRNDAVRKNANIMQAKAEDEKMIEDLKKEISNRDSKTDQNNEYTAKIEADWQQALRENNELESQHQANIDDIMDTHKRLLDEFKETLKLRYEKKIEDLNKENDLVQAIHEDMIEDLTKEIAKRDMTDQNSQYTEKLQADYDLMKVAHEEMIEEAKKEISKRDDMAHQNSQYTEKLQADYNLMKVAHEEMIEEAKKEISKRDDMTHQNSQYTEKLQADYNLMKVAHEEMIEEAKKEISKRDDMAHQNSQYTEKIETDYQQALKEVEELRSEHQANIDMMKAAKEEMIEDLKKEISKRDNTAHQNTQYTEKIEADYQQALKEVEELRSEYQANIDTMKVAKEEMIEDLKKEISKKDNTVHQNDLYIEKIEADYQQALKELDEIRFKYQANIDMIKVAEDEKKQLNSHVEYTEKMIGDRDQEVGEKDGAIARLTTLLEKERESHLLTKHKCERLNYESMIQGRDAQGIKKQLKEAGKKAEAAEAKAQTLSESLRENEDWKKKYEDSIEASTQVYEQVEVLIDEDHDDRFPMGPDAFIASPGTPGDSTQLSYEIGSDMSDWDSTQGDAKETGEELVGETGDALGDDEETQDNVPQVVPRPDTTVHGLCQWFWISLMLLVVCIGMGYTLWVWHARWGRFLSVNVLMRDSVIAERLTQQEGLLPKVIFSIASKCLGIVKKAWMLPG